MSQNLNPEIDADRADRTDRAEQRADKADKTADKTDKADKADKSEKNLADLPFEKLLHQLEVIVEHLEKGELTLERSLVAYERGMVIARAAQSRLDDMERRIETLTAEGRITPMNHVGSAGNTATNSSQNTAASRSSDENPRKKL